MSDRLPLAYPRLAKLPQRSNQPVLSDDKHRVVIGLMFGDWYAYCATCDAISLPCAERIDLARWVCPREDAESEIARNRDLWERRCADAAGYSDTAG